MLHVASSHFTSGSFAQSLFSWPRPLLSSLRYKISNALQLSKSKLSLWVACSTLPAPCHLLPHSLSSSSSSAALLPLSSALAINSFLFPLSSLFVGTFLCSAAASSFNQLAESQLDARMNRTKLRPLPCKRLSRQSARLFGLACTAGGVGLLSVGTNALTGGLGLLNIILYAKLYTPLKLVSPYNTHVGSLVGALPVLMGATAVTGSLFAVSPTCWALFAVQVLWQFPHFYALAWIYRDDYKNAGYKMFPLEDASGAATAGMIKPYMAALTALPILCACTGVASHMLTLDSLVVNTVMYFQFKKFEAKPSKQTARTFFLHSLWHLFALLGLTAYHGRPASSKCGGGGDSGGGGGGEEEASLVKERSNASEDLFAELRKYLRTKCPHEQVKGMQDSCPLHTIALCRSWLGDGKRKDCT
eukprot:GHVS01078268.1.p1 GENE.GHVS01078268.1~~GHVS01078268.1.p1  ORF type:complete len:417 (-),score=59.13 GHVS01078268.1:292-1542(-)